MFFSFLIPKNFLKKNPINFGLSTTTIFIIVPPIQNLQHLRHITDMAITRTATIAVTQHCGNIKETISPSPKASVFPLFMQPLMNQHRLYKYQELLFPDTTYYTTAGCFDTVNFAFLRFYIRLPDGNKDKYDLNRI